MSSASRVMVQPYPMGMGRARGRSTVPRQLMRVSAVSGAACANGKGGRLRAATGAQFGHDVRHMDARCALADEEPIRDLLVAQPVEQHAEDFLLAWREGDIGGRSLARRSG